MRLLFVSFLFQFIFSFSVSAQKNVISPEKLNPAPSRGIGIQQLFQDSVDCSSFLILIEKEVKKHKHLSHNEHVYVLEGRGKMFLGDESFSIRKGDLIFIPKNTFHSVKTTSKKPLKVISIQAPFFDGTDRVFAE